jgi:hypothetical protein
VVLRQIPLSHFIIISYTIQLREELELFFNEANWAVRDVPDLQDADRKLYAILAAMLA